MMTRKHFQLVADAVGAGTALDGQTRAAVVSELGAAFREENPRFDGVRFATAVEKAARDFADRQSVEMSPLPAEWWRR